MNDALRGVWCLCGGSLLIDGLLVVLLVRRALRRPPAMHYRAGFDATHPLPPMPARPVPPVVTPDPLARYTLQERAVIRTVWHETIEVARPLGWDAQPRKEYDL